MGRALLAGALLLAALVASFACTGGDDAAPPTQVVTLDEYAEWCGQVEQARRDSSTDGMTNAELMAALLEDVEVLLGTLQRIEPPAVLNDYHDTRVRVLAELRPLLVTLTDEMLRIDDSEALLGILYLGAIGIGAAIDSAVDALPSDARARLTATGCIDPPNERYYDQRQRERCTGECPGTTAFHRSTLAQTTITRAVG